MGVPKTVHWFMSGRIMHCNRWWETFEKEGTTHWSQPVLVKKDLISVKSISLFALTPTSRPLDWYKEWEELEENVRVELSCLWLREKKNRWVLKCRYVCGHVCNDTGEADSYVNNVFVQNHSKINKSHHKIPNMLGSFIFAFVLGIMPIHLQYFIICLIFVTMVIFKIFCRKKFEEFFLLIVSSSICKLRKKVAVGICPIILNSQKEIAKENTNI